MSNELIPVRSMTHKEWLDERRLGIGASESAPIMGVSPFASPYDIYISKIEGFQQEDTPRMKRGRILEGAVLSMLADAAGIVISGSVFARHETMPFVVATPDGVVMREGGSTVEAAAEAKTANPWTKDEWGEEGTDHIPDHYRIQTAHQMAVLDVPVCHLGVLFGLDDFRYYRIPRDNELERMILDSIVTFWKDHIEPRIPPSMEASRHAKQYLAKRYPRDLSPVVVADDLGAFLMQRRKRLTQAEALVKRGKLFVDNQLKELIGDRAGLALHDGKGAEKVTWKKSKDSKKTDWEKLARLLGASDKAIADHTKVVSGSRRFLPDRRWKEIEGG